MEKDWSVEYYATNGMRLLFCGIDLNEMTYFSQKWKYILSSALAVADFRVDLIQKNKLWNSNNSLFSRAYFYKYYFPICGK